MSDEDRIDIAFGARVDELKSALKDATDSTDKASDAMAKAAAGGARQLDDALVRLASHLDPAYKAMKQLNDGTETLDQGLKKGLITQAQYADYTAKLEANFVSATASAGQAAEGIGKVGLSATQTVNGVRALVDELASGRTRQAGGTFTRLAIEVASANLALAATAGVALAAAAAVGVIAYRWYEVNAAMNETQNSYLLLGRANEYNTSTTRGYIDQLKTVDNLGTTAAVHVVETMERIPVATEQVRSGLIKLAPALAALGDGDAAKSADKLAEAFAGGGSGVKKYLEGINALTPEMQVALDKAQQTNDINAAQEIGVKALMDRAYTPYLSILAQVAARYDNLKNSVDRAAAAEAGIDTPIAPIPEKKAGGSADDQAADRRTANEEAYLKTQRERLIVQSQIDDIQTKLNTDTASGQTAAAALDKEALANAQERLRTLRDPAQTQAYDLRIAKIKEEESAAATGSAAKVAALRQETAAAAQEYGEDSTQYLAARGRQAAGEREFQDQVLKIKVDALKARQNLDKDDIEQALIVQDQILAVIAAAGKKQTDEYSREIERRASLQREFTDKAFADAIAAMKVQLEAARDNGNQRLAIEADIVAAFKDKYKENSKEYQDALAEQLRITREVEAEKRAEVERTADNQIKLLTQTAAAMQKNVEFERQLGVISESEAMARSKAIADREFADQQQAMQRALAQDNLTVKEQQKLDQQLEQLSQAHSAKVEQIEQKRMLAVKQEWDELLKGVGSAFSSSITGMIEGTTTLQQAFANIGDAILSKMVNTFVGMGEEWIAQKVAMLVFGEATDDTTGESAAATARLQILDNAAVAGAAAFASIAAIPIVGPAAAPAAAGAAFLGAASFQSFVPGLATGTNYVPKDMLANIHEGEAVVPKEFNPAAGGAGGGGDIHFHITAFDSKDVTRVLMDNHGAVVQALQKAKRNFTKGTGY